MHVDCFGPVVRALTPLRFWKNIFNARSSACCYLYHARLARRGEPAFEKDIELKLNTIVPRPRWGCRYLKQSKTKKAPANAPPQNNPSLPPPHAFLLNDRSRELSIPFSLGVCRFLLQTWLWRSATRTKAVLWWVFLLVWFMPVMGWTVQLVKPHTTGLSQRWSLTLWQINDFHLGKMNRYWQLPMHCKAANSLKVAIM